MSLKAKDIAGLIETGLNRNLPDEKRTVLQAISLAQQDMAELRDFPKLRMKKSMSMSGADAELPNNLIGITGIKSATDVYFKMEEEETLSTDGRPHWYYASQTGTDPTASTYYNILDESGSAATDNVTVFYWAYPKIVTSDNDDILIPGPRALTLLSIVTLLGFIEHKPQESEPFRADYQIALKELLERYPATASAKKPTGRHGDRLAMGDIG